MRGRTLGVYAPAMTRRIEAVAVDFGGVLAQTPTDEAFARLAAAVGIEDDGLADAWLRHRLEYDLDALDPAQYWSLVGGRGYDGSALEELLVEDAACWAVPNEAMVAWLSAVKAAGLRLALLSNMPREQWTRLRAGVSWLDLCDVVILSYELRLAKPDPEIYRRCLDRLGLLPHEVVFVDDREENVAAAGGLGFESVLFTTVDELRRELELRFAGELPLP